MKISLGNIVWSSDKYEKNSTIKLNVSSKKDLDLSKFTAYAPLINSHDHLIGNWYPKADGPGRPYINSHLWVEEMKLSDSFKDRSKVWFNDGSFDLLAGESPKIALLGAYKNLFSGVGLVQDHAPNQNDQYYEMFPIEVLKKYTQCHSLTLGNWWGGDEAETEWKKSLGKIPFIVHLGEGLDEITRKEFSVAKQRNLLQKNTLLIHGISLTTAELKECAEYKTSVCWCPVSNDFLIGKTLNIKQALANKVNVVMATDSSMSGGINILDELKFAHNSFPEIEAKELYKMVSENAIKALLLNKDDYSLKNNSKSILITKTKRENPYENLLEISSDDIELFLLHGKPMFGNKCLLDNFDIDKNDYFTFKTKADNIEKFVIGHPEKTLAEFNSLLGYSKDFPYLPFKL